MTKNKRMPIGRTPNYRARRVLTLGESRVEPHFSMRSLSLAATLRERALANLDEDDEEQRELPGWATTVLLIVFAVAISAVIVFVLWMLIFQPWHNWQATPDELVDISDLYYTEYTPEPVVPAHWNDKPSFVIK